MDRTDAGLILVTLLSLKPYDSFTSVAVLQDAAPGRSCDSETRQLSRHPVNLRFLAALASGSFFAGCAPINVTDVSFSYFHLPTSTMVDVRQPITIPKETAHVTLQDGQVVAIDRLRRYEPFCELEVNDVLESEQQVRPGRFAATRIIPRQELGAQPQPVRLTEVAPFLRTAFAGFLSEPSAVTSYPRGGLPKVPLDRKASRTVGNST